VPYSGLSSYDEAYKKARLFVDNLKSRHCKEAGDKVTQSVILSKAKNPTQWIASPAARNDESSRASEAAVAIPMLPIRVLEVGAGYGEFALNFITAMRDICQREHLDYYDRLEYHLSDFSQRTIDELRSSGRLAEHESKIKYMLYDTLDNSSLRHCEAGTAEAIHLRSEAIPKLTFNLILANYLLDQFHVRIFVRSHGKYYEKYIALYDEEKRIAKYHAGKPERKWIKRIRKRHQFREVDLSDEIPALHLELLKSCFRFGAQASAVSYPYEALQVLENWLALLAPAGIIIVSDFNCASKSGYDALEPCYYGNSLAEGVNFSFITKYFSYSKFRDAMVEALDLPSGTRMRSSQQLALLYEDPIRPLHTLILTNNDFTQALELGESYQRVYMSNWLLRIFYKVMREIQVGSWIYALIVLGFLAYSLLLQ